MNTSKSQNFNYPIRCLAIKQHLTLKFGVEYSSEDTPILQRNVQVPHAWHGSISMWVRQHLALFFNISNP